MVTFKDSSLLDSVLHGANVAIHLISSTVPADIHIDFPNDLSDNLFTTINFLSKFPSIVFPHIIFASSASVYGDVTDLPYSRNLLTNPISSMVCKNCSREVSSVLPLTLN